MHFKDLRVKSSGRFPHREKICAIITNLAVIYGVYGRGELAYIPENGEQCPPTPSCVAGKQLLTTPRPPSQSAPRYPVLVLWVFTLIAGFVTLFHYEFVGAAPSGSPAVLPPAFYAESLPLRPTLIYFVHPRCPCTAAGIAELDRVLSDFPEAFETIVLFPMPEGAPDDWSEGPNRAAAARLPGVTLQTDTDARHSATFQVTTSGTALVYNKKGELLFQGGLTASRGHEGANFGERALRALARGEVPNHNRTPVFGCPLRHPVPGEAQEVAL